MVGSASLSIKLFIYRHYLLIVLTIAVPTVLLMAVLYAIDADWRLLLGVVGALLSFTYFIQRQQLEEAKLIKELISEFNKRYDDLNDILNDVLETEDDAVKSRACARNALYTYFNLCAEEYLFYRRGYIYPEVWEAWFKGMQTYFGNKRVQALWDEDPSPGSYYGLEQYVDRFLPHPGPVRTPEAG